MANDTTRKDAQKRIQLDESVVSRLMQLAGKQHLARPKLLNENTEVGKGKKVLIDESDENETEESETTDEDTGSESEGGDEAASGDESGGEFGGGEAEPDLLDTDVGFGGAGGGGSTFTLDAQAFVDELAAALEAENITISANGVTVSGSSQGGLGEEGGEDAGFEDADLEGDMDEEPVDDVDTELESAPAPAPAAAPARPSPTQQLESRKPSKLASQILEGLVAKFAKNKGINLNEAKKNGNKVTAKIVPKAPPAKVPAKPVAKPAPKKTK